jgi:CHASE3 domain sensor protein
MGKQTMRQAARLAASQVYAKRRRERAQRDRRLEKLAIEVLTALAERDATIAATEQRAGAALQAMITDESLTVSEAVRWCAGAISQREAARLRQLNGQAQNKRLRRTAPLPPTFDDPRSYAGLRPLAR